MRGDFDEDEDPDFEPEPRPDEDCIQAAIVSARLSPCRSKRGVAVFDRGGLIVAEHNRKPEGFSCDGSAECKATCRNEAIHAEQAAILWRTNRWRGAEMLHVKVVDGSLVPSGGPSCVQCSKLILASGLSAMWLYHASGWRRYSVFEFHRLSLVGSDNQAAPEHADAPGRSAAPTRRPSQETR